MKVCCIFDYKYVRRKRRRWEDNIKMDHQEVGFFQDLLCQNYKYEQNVVPER
jgi:hypothetical protein